MILDQLFEATGEDSTAQRVAEVLRQVHPDPSEATEREILAATGRVLSDQGMSDVSVRFYLRDPDFQSDIIEAVQALIQGISEGHADQQRKIVKKNGEPVGEIGIDRESSPGVGQYYMRHYASDTDLSGYDSFEDAMDELKYAVKQSVEEAMKPSDIPPSMRDRLTMRDIERERPEGAFRFRVTFDDGSHTDFMDFESARASADIEQGRISRLSETQAQHGRKAHSGKRSTARIDRILQLLRARNPQAQNDLEALILDFRGQQAQDRSDIARLDAENDMEEADIERLEAMLTQLKQRRGTAVAEATADPQQNRAIVQSLANPAAQSRMQQHSADFDKMLSQPGYDHRPGVKSELAVSRQQQRQQWIDAVKNLQHWDDPLGVIRIALNKGITVDEVLKNLPAGMDLNALREQQGVAEAAPTEATQFYQQQYQREMQRHGSPRMAKEMASRATAQKFGPNWNIIMKQPGQPDRYARPADAEMLDRGRRELRDLMAKEDIAESLRDGEYHVATVTLDDGTVKKVRITSDEGFRDQIRKHFEKQGREVRDIDVDYSVRSELDEAKKKPQPTNPELWSRAKSAARSKFDVWPSAYASAWAAKYYKSKGGGWRMGKGKKD